MVGLLSQIKRILLGVVGLLFITALAGASYQWLANRGDLAATHPPGRLVDVGGHRLHIWCTDSVEPGTPTVLFDSDLATLSTRACQVIAEDSGHGIGNQPKLVVEAIREVLLAAEDAVRKPGC